MKTLRRFVSLSLFLVIAASIFAAFKGDAMKFPNKNWNLILVNKDNLVPDGYNFDKKEIYNGIYIDERIYPELQEMLNKMEEDGLYPEVTSGYRSRETQTKLFEDKVSELIAEGNTQEQAEKEASRSIALPGTSEHEIGLAVDISEKNVDWTTENFYKWLENNSYKYGFILRYPYGKTDITHIKYEPWHFRFVGKEDAQKIFERELTLEEYLSEQ